MPSFAVMRSPCFMEDQGRYEYVAAYATHEEAQKAIDNLVEKSKGYFSHGNYEIWQRQK